MLLSLYCFYYSVADFNIFCRWQTFWTWRAQNQTKRIANFWFKQSIKMHLKCTVNVYMFNIQENNQVRDCTLFVGKAINTSISWVCSNQNITKLLRVGELHEWNNSLKNEYKKSSTAFDNTFLIVWRQTKNNCYSFLSKRYKIILYGITFPSCWLVATWNAEKQESDITVHSERWVALLSTAVLLVVIPRYCLLSNASPDSDLQQIWLWLLPSTI